MGMKTFEPKALFLDREVILEILDCFWRNLKQDLSGTDRDIEVRWEQLVRHWSFDGWDL